MGRIRTALSPNREKGPEGRLDGESLDAIMSRSESRGREIFSTGRGGAGNAIRSPSRSKADLFVAGESIAPGSERGRTVPSSASEEKKIMHTGRGGVGNTRSPSANGRAQKEKEDRLEEQMVAERRGREEFADAPFSTGRGGVGNIGGSRSRSRSRLGTNNPHGHESAVHHIFHHGHKDRDGELSKTTTTTSNGTVGAEKAAAHGNGSAIRSASPYASGGRGGFGNIVPIEELSPEERRVREAEQEMDAEILKKYRANHPAAAVAGRGGEGNINTPTVHEPAETLANLSLEEKAARERVAAEEAKVGKTHGHGGAGNYTPAPHPREIDHLQAEEGVRGRGSNGNGDGPLKRVMRSLSRNNQK